jgi:EmrB/QacA subfamily drug resistance transporter
VTVDPASAESSGRGGSAVPLEQSAAAEPFAMLPELDEAIPAEVSTGAPERRASPALILAVLCVAQFFSALDVFIVNVALTPIGRGLHESSLSNLSWILNGYAIVYAALLVPAGRLADRYGRRGGFLLGLGLFTAASLGSALSGSLWVLVAFRLLQAGGAAILTPASLGLVLATAPAQKTARYVQSWAISGSLAAAAGPALGGLLVQASWRWIFLINLPIGIVALVAAARLLPRIQHDQSARIPDLLGGAILIITVGSLALALDKAPDWGWGSERVVTALATAAAGLALFVLRSSRARTPVVDLSLFRNTTFGAANTATLAFYAGFAIILLGLVLWMQDDYGWSAIKTGLLIAPSPCLVIVGATLGQHAAKRVPAGVVAAFGALLAAVGCVMMALSTSSRHISYAGQILPGWLIVGVGVGFALPTLISSATQDLADHQAATGSAVVTMAGQIGSVIGVSLLVIFLAFTGHPGDPHHNFAAAWLLAAGLMLLSAVTALTMTHRRSARATP